MSEKHKRIARDDERGLESRVVWVGLTQGRLSDKRPHLPIFRSKKDAKEHFSQVRRAVLHIDGKHWFGLVDGGWIS